VLILTLASVRQMQALGWRYMLFPGLFGALVLMVFAAATDELARFQLAMPALPTLPCCGGADKRFRACAEAAVRVRAR
jgi:hypothetical protein